MALKAAVEKVVEVESHVRDGRRSISGAMVRWLRCRPRSCERRLTGRSDFLLNQIYSMLPRRQPFILFRRIMHIKAEFRQRSAHSTNTVGCPVPFTFLAKSGNRKCRSRVGLDYVSTTRSNSTAYVS